MYPGNPAWSVMAVELSTIKSSSPSIPILPSFELLSLGTTKYLLSLQ